jgi:hypothetical protein
VLGHWACVGTTFGAGGAYALLGAGWLTCLVRDFLGEGLLRLGLPPELWYDVALVGIGEVAATANDEEFGRGHLMLLAGLPDRPPEPGRTRRDAHRAGRRSTPLSSVAARTRWRSRSA